MEINPNFSPGARADLILVKEANNGDQKAYAALMQRYKDPVYFIAYKMVKNKVDAMDLTIETFGKAFEKLDKYNPDFAFSTWLFRIATNSCIDFLRRKKMILISIDEERNNYEINRIMQLKANDLDPEEMSIKRQESEYLKGMVDSLPSRYREVVTLRYYDELSYEEIALQLDTPIGTIKAQLFRAKDLILAILNQKKNNCGF